MLSKGTETERLVSALRAAASKCLREVPQRLLTSQGRSVARVKPDGDPTLEAELYVEEIGRASCRETV